MDNLASLSFWLLLVSPTVLRGSDGKASTQRVGDLGLIPGWEDPLEKEMAMHSSTLA